MYNDAFFQSIDAGSRRSAAIVTRLLREHIKIDSVLDVGCGRGAWARAWLDCGVTHVVGVDGDYQSRDSLYIPEERFIPLDLSEPFELDEDFDLVMSVEVAEHLPERAADGFIRSLAAHGNAVLFSAAVPGQGGLDHINEQPHEYWRAKFRAQGFECYDFLRIRLRNRNDVEHWYRFNSFLYVRPDGAELLSDEVRATRIPDDAPLPDLAPLWWRLRNTMIGLLPAAAVTGLSALKHATNSALHRR